MIKFLPTLFCFILLSAAGSADAQKAEEQLKHGEIENRSGEQVVWSSHSNSWISVEAFWIDYVDGQGGLTWEESDQYPPFSEVNEFDTFLVRVPTGVCLMEFFHSRWRRANDVRRWDDEFNNYGGCPNVFN